MFNNETLNDEPEVNEIQISYKDFQPCDRPEPYTRKKVNSIYKQILEDFLASDNETIVKEFDDKSDAQTVYTKFQYLCRQYPMKNSVTVCIRGSRIYLVKLNKNERKSK